MCEVLVFGVCPAAKCLLLSDLFAGDVLEGHRKLRRALRCDSYIVRVKAVVMTRDDSSGGWLPQEGGGLSRVGVCKVTYPEGNGRSGFLIHGERQKDKLVVLECFVKKDLVYTKANPTFHHWKVDNRKFGLTFQSPADARAFDRGVRKAIEDLIEGSTTSSSTLHNEAEVGDDDVFTYATDSSSNSSQKREQPVRTLASPASCEHRRICTRSHLHDHYSSDHYHLEQSVPRSYRHVNFPDDDEEIVRINPREKIWMTGYEDYRHAPARGKNFDPDDMDSYVRFAKSEASKHEYTYPYIDNSEFDLGEDIKGAVIKTQPVKFKPRRKEDGERSRCVYCRDMFNHEENKRGQCQDAPDRVKTCIHRVSCMWCADTMLYHCMSDPEGDYTDPCSCDTSDEMFCLRWMALIALSFIAPFKMSLRKELLAMVVDCRTSPGCVRLASACAVPSLCQRARHLWKRGGVAERNRTWKIL
ncbi:sprouty-related, EVH1 domain-containing protein 2 [Apteryx rowi]|uniref:sprouty-related, EVH1 domain-containing protein 2 n=1 Tax=Apteryx rowi TaxID=308060 RepID=UPI000E1E0A00|nr:sprouty-related, EVH1 domain-containing protein 2 [Apteryx rowi]